MAAAHDRYPHLFSPLRLRNATLRNRIAQSALTSASGRDGRVTGRMLNIYRARARGGAAMIVTESLAGHSRQQVGRRMRAMEERMLPDLQRWAEVVESADCRLLGQLMDPGRGRHHAGRTGVAAAPSPLPDDLSWSVPRALTGDEIARMIEELAETARRLQRAGFSGVELSCAHGHLFHQFLSPQSNLREDDYGGSRENRTRFVRELCDAVRAACVSPFILGIKLVGDDGVPGGVGPDESALLAREIARHDVDYFAIAQGAHHRSLEMHVPDRSYPPAAYREIARTVRAALDRVPVLAIGRLTRPDEAEALIEQGCGDGVMLGRALLADADWPEKARAGREDAIRLCINCNTCWEQTVSGNPIACDVNPRVGTADEHGWRPPRAASARRIAVVGSGPAGLECAWIAASRGHDVTLFGAGAEAGGKLRLNAALPGCAQIGRVTRFQLDRAREAGVRLRLGTAASVDDVRATAPDVVVLATGSTIRRPRDWVVDGDAATDIRTLARRLLESPDERREGTAVLFDGDHAIGTYDMAIFLSTRFERLVIITPRECLAQDLATVVRQRVYRQLSARRAIVHPLHDVAAVRPGRVVMRNVYSGDETAIDDVACFAYASWRLPSDALAGPLLDAGLTVHRIGDARVPRTLLDVLAEGHRTGLAL